MLRLLFSAQNNNLCQLICLVLYYDKSLDTNLTPPSLFLLIIRIVNDLYSLVGFKILNLTIQLNLTYINHLEINSMDREIQN